MQRDGSRRDGSHFDETHSAQFDPTGRQTNASFGKVIATKDARKMMVGIKFVF